MNVFLDTTVLYNDPYFRSHSNRLLLEKSKKYTFKLYISVIVIKELRKQLERRVEKFNKQIKDAIKSISGNCLDLKHYNFDEILVDKELKFFDEFYNNITKNEDVIIVDYEDKEQEILERILEKAINKQKPFKENGEGFKDALIWESYILYASYRDMKNCILISDNVRDFANAEYKKNDQTVHSIHDDLLSEFPYFLKLYRNSKTFLKGEKLKSIRENAPYWLGEKYQDETQLYNLIFSKNHYSEYIILAVKNTFLNSDLLEKKGIYFVNYIETTSYSIKEFKIIGFEEYENDDGRDCMIELLIIANFEMNLYFQKNIGYSESPPDLKFIDAIKQEFIFESSVHVEKEFNFESFQIDKTKIK